MKIGGQSSSAIRTFDSVFSSAGIPLGYRLNLPSLVFMLSSHISRLGYHVSVLGLLSTGS